MRDLYRVQKSMTAGRHSQDEKKKAGPEGPAKPARGEGARAGELLPGTRPGAAVYKTAGGCPRMFCGWDVHAVAYTHLGQNDAHQAPHSAISADVACICQEILFHLS